MGRSAGGAGAPARDLPKAPHRSGQGLTDFSRVADLFVRFSFTRLVARFPAFRDAEPLPGTPGVSVAPSWGAHGCMGSSPCRQPGALFAPSLAARRAGARDPCGARPVTFALGRAGLCSPDSGVRRGAPKGWPGDGVPLCPRGWAPLTAAVSRSSGRPAALRDVPAARHPPARGARPRSLLPSAGVGRGAAVQPVPGRPGQRGRGRRRARPGPDGALQRGG